MRRTICRCLVQILVLSLAIAPVLAQTDPTTAPATTAKALYERVTPSLVVVQYIYDSELGRNEVSAMGIVVREDGLVMFTSTFTPSRIPDEQITNFKIIIPGEDQKEIEAEFQGRDERTNLAFVKPKSTGDGDKPPPRTWTPLKFADAKLEIGEGVSSIGLLPKDAGYKSYLTTVRVAALLRGPVPQVLVDGGLTTVGSPVFNAAGQAIGFVHGQRDHSPLLNVDDRRDTSFGVVYNPPRMFVPARDFLISTSEPPIVGQPLKMPHIGVAQLSGLKKDVAEWFGLKPDQPGVQVGDVIEGFPAAKGGLKPGDVIIKMNGQFLERGDEPDETPAIMTRKIQRMKVGDTVKLAVLVDKDQPYKEVAVTLEERPMQENRAKRFFAEDLGFSAREIVFEDTYRRRIAADTKGVVVALIKPNSSAQTGNLERGDLITRLNQTPVESLDQFKQQYEAFRKERARDAVVMEVLRGVNTQVVRIEPPQ
jgi:S1-C subfamily serine protease